MPPHCVAGSLPYYLIISSAVVAQSLDKLPKPASEVACQSYNIDHNRFKNIHPCECNAPAISNLLV